MRRQVLLLLAAMVPGIAFADSSTPIPAAFDPLTSAYLIKLVFSLILVLALMFAVIWMLKRAGQMTGVMGRYPMTVLAQISVGTRERVLLIKVGERQLLIGVAQGQIEALGWVDPPLVPQSTTDAGRSGRVSFAQLLNRQFSATNRHARDAKKMADRDGDAT